MQALLASQPACQSVQPSLSARLRCCKQPTWTCLPAARARADGHVWRGEVEVPAGAAVEFKPVLRQGQQTTWMGGNNLVREGCCTLVTRR